VRGATAADGLYAPYFYAAIVEAEFPGVALADVPERAFAAPIAFASLMLQTVEAHNVPIVTRYAAASEIVAVYRELFENSRWRGFVEQWLRAVQSANAAPMSLQKKT
jgi:hypothetical protein